VVVRNALTQAQSVYYVGTDNKIWTWFYAGPGSGWSNGLLPGQTTTVAPGTSLAALRDPKTGDLWLYFVGTGTEKHIWTMNLAYGASTWGYGKVGVGGRPVAANSSPALVRDPTTGRQQVFYVGDNQAIYSWFFDGVNPWANGRLGSGGGTLAAPGASPAALMVPATNAHAVYYVGAENQIWTWYFSGASGGAWENGKVIGSGSVAIADPSVTPYVVRSLRDEKQWVYFVGSDKNVWNWYFDGANPWFSGKLGSGGQLAATGSPITVVQNPANEGQSLYYKASDGSIWSWGYGGPGASWVNGKI